MRHLTVLLCALLLPLVANAQVQSFADTTQPVRVAYERLDQIQKSTGALSPTQGQITFNLVRLRNLDTGSTVEGVEVTVSKGGETEVSSMSTGMLGAVLGTSTEYVNAFGAKVAEAGFIFLSMSDLTKITEFLEKYPASVQTDRRKIWKIWLTKDFELGVQYSPEDYDGTSIPTGYSFLVTAAGTTYRMDWDAGLEVTKKLTSWHERLSSTD